MDAAASVLTWPNHISKVRNHCTSVYTQTSKYPTHSPLQENKEESEIIYPFVTASQSSSATLTSEPTYIPIALIQNTSSTNNNNLILSASRPTFEHGYCIRCRNCWPEISRIFAIVSTLLGD